jgi:hypothetical protein
MITYAGLNVFSCTRIEDYFRYTLNFYSLRGFNITISNRQFQILNVHPFLSQRHGIISYNGANVPQLPRKQRRIMNLMYILLRPTPTSNAPAKSPPEDRH